MSTREAGAADIGIDAASQSSKWPKQRSSYAGDMSFPTEKRQPLLLHQPQPTIQRTDPAACSYPSFTFAKDSIFYKEPLNVEPNSTAYSSCGSWPLKHSVPSHAIPPIVTQQPESRAESQSMRIPFASQESKPISRNFIFDTVQSISKPAVKMNATELAALRAGRDIQQAPSPSSACSTLPCSDDGGARITEPQKCSNANSSQSCVMGNEVRSMTVPLSLPSQSTQQHHHNNSSYHDFSFAKGSDNIMNTTQQQQSFSQHWGADLAKVDTAYLRSMNRDTRRGFIDLDEVMIPTSRLYPAIMPETTTDISMKMAGRSSNSSSPPPLISALHRSSSTTHDMSLSSKRGFQNDDDDEKTQLATNDIVRSTNISDNNKVCRPAKQLHGSKSLPKTKLDLLATPSPITHPAVWNQINLSFLPTAKNFLGEGRYAEVYRGSYTLSGDAGLSIGSPRSAQSSQALSSVTCAALGGRRRSSTSGSEYRLAESFILRRVAGLHRNIVSLIGVKDEADLHALTVKNKLVQLLDTFPSMQVEPTQHSAKSTANQSVQSYSKPPSTASGKKKSPTAATAPNPAPQLLLVLEYLPNGNLWDWAMRHKESVGRILWMKWARELAGAIEAIHSIGIVHHDIKPHNILLSDLLDIRLADFGNACFVPEMGPDQILERLSPTAASPASFNHTGAGDSSLKKESPAHNSPHTPNTQQHCETLRDDTTISSEPLLSEPLLKQIMPFAHATSSPSDLHQIESSSLKRPVAVPPALLISSHSLKSDLPSTTTPSLARQSTPVLPGSPTSPNSQSLTNGLGRGTLAYSAPDLFNSTTAYSFPVDMYSLGVTLYALISGCEPFGLARTSVHMMVGIQRGFFESGMQHSRIFSGPSQRGGGRSGEVMDDPAGFVWKFMNGEAVPDAIVKLLRRLLSRDPALRPLASETVSILEYIDAAI
ncbi:hypothetical protein BSLG_004020 [Batrachochytrium salamandrivorans]|nr:hypothetical protein BSLG_004020 [Batrachochytrium salamandrivorans]